MNKKKSSIGKPGPTGTPLNGDDGIIRLGLEQSDYKEISANAFVMSGDERKETWKRISVWESALTTEMQAYRFVSNPKRKVAIYLNVGDVRNIKVDGITPLDVKWDWLEECLDSKGERNSTYTTGCEGHCAIDGIDVGSRPFRKKIRKRLAEMVNTKKSWSILEIEEQGGS